MKKVRFELNIDVVVEGGAYPDNDHEVFKSEDATGKTFLFVDKLTGDKQAAYCKRAATNGDTYASVNFFPISPDAVIIDDEEMTEISNNQIIEYISECREAIQGQIGGQAERSAERYNLIMEGMKGMFDKLEEGGGHGISEKTLLKAIEIVSKSQV